MHVDESAERSHADRALAEDLKLISTLQQQVESSQTALKAAKSEAKRLSDALARREEEILKYARKSGTLDATVGSDENRIQNLLAADTSNQRIIEQLNGQVDFLNEHLALRERQLAESGRELAGVRELKSECDHR
jgi:predicted  nucleic acid-binding Zn-ribbon protein